MTKPDPTTIDLDPQTAAACAPLLQTAFDSVYRIGEILQTAGYTRNHRMTKKLNDVCVGLSEAGYWCRMDLDDD